MFRKQFIGLLMLVLVGLLAACDLGGGVSGTPTSSKPANAVEITIAYAPEFGFVYAARDCRL